MNLKGYQKRFLRSQAHHLEPVVMIGKQGLAESVIYKIDEELNHHELIKVRFVDYDRHQQKEMMADIEEKTSSLCAGKIGHLGIFYRPNPDPDKIKVKLPQRGNSIEK